MAIESDERSELLSGATTATRTIGQERQSSGGQEFLHVHELSQSPVDHNLTQWQNRGQQHHNGSW